MVFFTFANAVTNSAEKQLQIATFDSGFGGYFTAHAIAQKAKQLQQQNKLNRHVVIHHFGDTANAPYGEKTPSQIAEFTSQGVIKALKKGADYIFIACNTASTQYEKVQQEVEKAFPNQKKSQKIFSIIDTSTNQLKQSIDSVFVRREKLRKSTDDAINVNVLILSTPATMKSNTYIKKLSEAYNTGHLELSKQELLENRWFHTKTPTATSYIVKQTISLSNKKTITIHQISPVNWVEMIEYGATIEEKEKNITAIFKHFSEINETLNTIDVVAEFCTHYPVLDSTIKKTLKKNKMIDSQTTFILQGPLMANIFAQKVQLKQNENQKNDAIHSLKTLKNLKVITDITISGNNVQQTNELLHTVFPSKNEIPVVQEK